METIVSLLPDDTHLASVEQELRAAGFSGNEMHELHGSADFWKQLCSKEKTRLILRTAAIGALIGLGFGGVYGAFPVVLNCESGCPIGTGLILFALFVLFCASAGALFGSLIGLDRAECSLLSLVANARRDQSLFVVETSSKAAPEVRHILEQHGTVVNVSHEEMEQLEEQGQEH
jgi:hypothetical protein